MKRRRKMCEENGSKASEPNLCRLCACGGNKNLHVFAEDGVRKQLLSKIHYLLQITISDEDPLPKLVCEQCVAKVESFYSFKKTCLEAESFLENQLKHEEEQMLVEPECCILEESPKKMEAQIEKAAEESKEASSSESEEVDVGTTEANVSVSAKPATEIKSEPLEENTGMDMVHFMNENNGYSGKENVSEEATQSSALGEEEFQVASPLEHPCLGDYMLIKEDICYLRDTNDKDFQRFILARLNGMQNNNNNNQSAMQGSSASEDGEYKKKVLVPCMWDLYEKTADEGKTVVNHKRYVIAKKSFVCGICGPSYPPAAIFNQDSMFKIKKEFVCVFCGKVYLRRAELFRHERTHSEDKPYSCTFCGKGFFRKEHMSRHMTLHKGVKPYSCDVCIKTFTRKEHLDRHKICHITGDWAMIKPFTCDLCGKSFTRKEHLGRHRLTHFRERVDHKKYSCETCSVTFASEENLLEHEKMHNSVPDVENKPSVCTICGKACKSVEHYKSHVEKHVSETLVAKKIYTCELCSLTFPRKKYLVKHRATHLTAASNT